MKGKGCNIAAGVLDILISVCYFVFALIVFFAGTLIGGIIGEVGGSGSAATDAAAAVAGLIVTIVALMFLVGFVIYLAFGITTLVKCGKAADQYHRARGTMLGFSIVETIMFAGLLYLSVAGMTVFTGILLAMAALAVVLHWVGYALNKKQEQAPVGQAPNVAIEEVKSEVQDLNKE